MAEPTRFQPHCCLALPSRADFPPSRGRQGEEYSNRAREVDARRWKAEEALEATKGSGSVSHLLAKRLSLDPSRGRLTCCIGQQHQETTNYSFEKHCLELKLYETLV